MDAKVKPAMHDKSILVCRSAALRDDAISTVAELNSWFVNYVDCSEELLERIEQYHYDILIIGIPADAEQTVSALGEIIRLRPDAVRIVVASNLSPTLTARVAEVAHSSLPFDCTHAQVSCAVERALKVIGLIQRPEIKRVIGGIKRLPSLPAIYEKLNQALMSGHANANDISEILEQDPAMAAKVLQLVNSAFFGLERQIYRLNEAVTILGLRLIRDLALSSHLFEALPSGYGWDSLSFEQIHQRSLLVARLAQDISRSVGADRNTQAQAFLAGLLSDFGMLLLANHDPEGYRKVVGLSGEMQQPLYVVEKMHIGVSHAEAGAYLLGLWNLPPAVIEAVLFHHFPASSASDEFQPLTAVHAADALLAPVSSAYDAKISSQLALKYLERLGVEHKLNDWQALAAKYQ